MNYIKTSSGQIVFKGVTYALTNGTGNVGHGHLIGDTTVSIFGIYGLMEEDKSNKIITDLQKSLIRQKKQLETVKNSFSNETTKMTIEATALINEIKSREMEIKYLTNKLNTSENECTTFIVEHNIHTKTLSNEIATLVEKGTRLKKEVTQLKKLTATKNRKLLEKDKRITALNRIITLRNKKIMELNSHKYDATQLNYDLDNIKNELSNSQIVLNTYKKKRETIQNDYNSIVVENNELNRRLDKTSTQITGILQAFSEGKSFYEIKQTIAKLNIANKAFKRKVKQFAKNCEWC